jgi:predicted lipoprotein with Yx(FWY)xxD motif
MTIRIVLGATVAALALVTACSSSSKSNSSTPSSTPAGGGASSSGVTISANGSTLTGPDGHTLYANTVDTASKITCTGACANLWPPVIGKPSAGKGVPAGMLATATRPDGTTQATFGGHPLYEFAADKAAGDQKGQGIADQGGTWHVATVSGGAPSTPLSTVPSSSSTGYNY